MQLKHVSVLSILLSVLLFSAVGRGEEATPEVYTGRPPVFVAVFWVGLEAPALKFKFDIDDVVNAYKQRGYRVLKFNALSGPDFRRELVRDREENPQDYRDSVVSFVIHGRHAQGQDPSVSDTTLFNELVQAFLDGIGSLAEGDVISGSCFAGMPCKELSLEGTPFSGKLKRVTGIYEEPKAFSPEDIRKARRARFLSDVLDVLFTAPELRRFEATFAFRSKQAELRNPDSNESVLAPREALFSGIQILPTRATTERLLPGLRANP